MTRLHEKDEVIMEKWKQVLSGTAAAILLLVGCGSSTSNDDDPAPVKPFTAAVDISDFSPQCQQEACWLPTQLEPKLVERETVSLYDEWPMDHDKVQVLCQVEGESFNDEAGKPTNLWYGIRIPANKVEAAAKSRAEKARAGGYLAYVGAVWLTDEHKRAPICKR